ncbi:hypothetical protein RM780_19925 [Streptomyces sp. DSM 44917]|uniref:Phage holin family protein n=1 Tax=Streptomyces boetiae TaxID=3075541 RepID=A0ABU2LCA3_9ACTN|nr:hypothetical protein [Streptomyces sp. DSM 44917]MDT0309214.1 hypothetical protein [Streptomyces sp. DSM 44917]
MVRLLHYVLDNDARSQRLIRLTWHFCLAVALAVAGVLGVVLALFLTAAYLTRDYVPQWLMPGSVIVAALAVGLVARVARGRRGPRGSAGGGASGVLGAAARALTGPQSQANPAPADPAQTSAPADPAAESAPSDSV